MNPACLRNIRLIKLNFEDLSEYFPLIPTFFAEISPVLAFFPSGSIHNNAGKTK